MGVDPKQPSDLGVDPRQEDAGGPLRNRDGRLELAGERGLGAPSAEEGLRIFKESEPAAVIVDLMMEEVDAGMNFARELRFLRSEVPIFMLSSVGDDFNLTADYSDLGLAGIFQKPVPAETLATVLRAALS